MQRIPVFYGWIVVAGLMVFAAVGVGLAGANIALFVGPVTGELGWDASTFGWAQFFRLSALVVAGPVIGRALDRYGPRVPAAIAVVVAGGLTVALSWMSASWQLIGTFVLMGLVGMGRAPELYINPPVARWFIRRRGLAMGIALAGTPLGAVILFPLTQALIDVNGWREALRILGIGGMAVAFPMVMLLRRRPEDIGQQPDGDSERAATGQGGRAPTRERSLTRAQAVRTPAFWFMTVGFAAVVYGESTLALFRVPHFVERGIDPSLVAAAIAVDASIAVTLSVVLGRALDSIDPRLVLAAGVGGAVTCAVGLILVEGPVWLFAANIGYAVGFQSSHVAQNVMWANVFGREHIGRIRGVALPVIIVFGATAFPVTGLIRDSTGVYTPAWVVAIVASTLGLLLAMRVRLPSRNEGPLAV